MTALAANYWNDTRNNSGRKGNAVILTSAVIYHGALVELTSAGKLQPLAAGTTATFAGVAFIERPTGTGGLTGDGTVRCDFLIELDMLLPVTGATAGNAGGQAIYGLDDNTLTIAPTAHPQVGTLEELVTSTSGWARIRGSAMAKGT